VEGLLDHGRRGGQDKSCFTRKRVGICAVAAVALGTAATLAGVFGSRAANRSANRRPDITYDEILGEGPGMPPGNVFAGKLHDDAFLAAMSSVFQGPPVVFANNEEVEQYSTYFRAGQLDQPPLAQDEGKTTIRLPRQGDKNDCIEHSDYVDIEQGPLKQLIKDSDPENPTWMHPVGVRVLEQAMIQEIGVEALESQTAEEALISLTGMPVTEMKIPSVTESGGAGCVYNALEWDANHVIKAAAQALRRGEPVLLTRPDTPNFDCGYNDAMPEGERVYSVLDAKPATNTTEASLTLKDPRGATGAWPDEPGSDLHATDEAENIRVGIKQLGSSKLSFGKQEQPTTAECG
jgi:hypothetical protein